MKEKILFLIYNIIVLPTMFFGLKIASIFNKKIKRGIAGRKRIFEELILNAQQLDKTKKMIWVHSSSLGEFEQAKPIIEKLKNDFNINVLVTFFSPSGYENSKKYQFADLVSYLPYDTKFNAKNILSIVKPSLVIFTRYDIWPNLVREIGKNSIPLFLVDATLRKDSFRKFFISKSLHEILYKQFTRILTVSTNDVINFKEYGLDESRVFAVGDTRFDRVYERSLSARNKNIIKQEILTGKKIFVAGSTWHEDEEIILPSFLKAAKFDSSLMMIIAPHEPDLNHLEALENEFRKKISFIRFSHLNNYAGERVIIVDSIGILFTLYSYAHLAFVGGGFKYNIHNILEAAVYGIPVLFGPKITNSQEAPNLIYAGGGFIIKNKKEAYRYLRTFLSNEIKRKNAGEASTNYINKNLGATAKIIGEIKTFVN